MSWFERFKWKSVGLLAILLVFGCGAPDTFNRKQMLKDTVDQVIEPTHSNLDEKVSNLEDAVTTFCGEEQNSSELESARESWNELQKPLKKILSWSFNMSPYRGMSFDILLYKIDRAPAWADNIEAVISGEGTYRQDLNSDGDEEPDAVFPEGDNTIDAEFISEQDYRRNAKGIPAVEYLLFASKDGTEPEELYSGDSEAANRRCRYLVEVTKHARTKIDDYVSAWSRDDGDFAGRFSDPSSENEDWTTVQDSINAMVSQMVFVSKQLISKQYLGGPLGQHEENETIPNRVAAPYGDATLVQIKAILDGLEAIYTGGDGKSLGDFTKFRKKSVHDLVKNRISDARDAINEIPEPLEEAVEEDPDKVEAAQEAIDELARAIESDLKTTLGASTTRVVVDND